MIIKKVNINSFGKIHNYSLDFSSGLNVVYGENEYGKTTIMNFIKLMFYGKCEKSKVLREKYLPWDGSQMCGNIEFEHDKKIYRVQKEIHSQSPSKDKVLFQNLSLGEIVKLGKGQEVGEYLFGIDVKCFERSAYIANISNIDFAIKSGAKSKDTLNDKILSNLSESGEEDVSKSDVIKRINEAITDLRAKRGSGGKIDIAEIEIRNLKQKISDFENFEKSSKNIIEELKDIESLRKEREELSEKLSCLERAHKKENIKKLILLSQQKSELENQLFKSGFKKDNIENQLSELNKLKEELFYAKNELKNIENLVEKSKNEFLEISPQEKEKLATSVKKSDSLNQRIKKLQYIFGLDIEQTQSFIKSDFGSESLLDENIQEIFKEYNNLKRTETLDAETANDLSKKIQQKENQRIQKLEQVLKAKSSFNSKKLVIVSSLVISVILSLTLIFSGLTTAGYCFLAITMLLGFIGVLFLNKNFKTLKDLENDIELINNEFDSMNNKVSDVDLKNSESQAVINNLINNLKIKENMLIENAKLELYEIDSVIQNLLYEKKCSSVDEFYSQFAKTENFKLLLKSREDCTKKIDLIYTKCKEYSKSESLNINFEDFCNEIDRFDKLNRKLEETQKYIQNYSKVIGIKEDELSNIKETDYNNDERSETENLSVNISEIKEKLNYLKSLNLDDKYLDLKNQLEYHGESGQSLKNKLVVQNQKLESMKSYFTSLELALEILEESSDELKKGFNSKLDLRASQIFKSLTSGKYEKVYIQKNYGLSVESDGIVRLSNSFSSGTVDQAYIALRIAISEFISPENSMPFLFDDSFMQCDDARLKNAIDFLKNYTKKENRQAIIFTCHSYVSKLCENDVQNIMNLPA